MFILVYTPTMSSSCISLCFTPSCRFWSLVFKRIVCRLRISRSTARGITEPSLDCRLGRKAGLFPWSLVLWGARGRRMLFISRQSLSACIPRVEARRCVSPAIMLPEGDKPVEDLVRSVSIPMLFSVFYAVLVKFVLRNFKVGYRSLLAFLVLVHSYQIGLVMSAIESFAICANHNLGPKIEVCPYAPTGILANWLKKK